MPNISEKELNKIRNSLLEYKKQLQQEIHDELIKEGSSPALSLAGKVHDKQEESLSEMLTEINLGLLKQHQHELKNLEAARLRCANCHCPSEGQSYSCTLH
jgi:DnaK suppressor protein